MVELVKEAYGELEVNQANTLKLLHLFNEEEHKNNKLFYWPKYYEHAVQARVPKVLTDPSDHLSNLKEICHLGQF